jgi:hypothetical protein
MHVVTIFKNSIEVDVNSNDSEHKEHYYNKFTDVYYKHFIDALVNNINIELYNNGNIIMES